MKRISILGSTGSIGTQCLDVISGNRDRFSVAALSCSKSIELLCRQIEELSPAAVCVAEEADAAELSKKYSGIEFFHGDEGLRAIAAMEDCDMVVNSLMGMRGLEPTMAAIEAGKDIAFANKETLVVGGQLVMDAVKRRGVKLLPVDSEHSAVFQCIQGSAGNEIRRLILTASGGPFRGYSAEQLKSVTLEQALAHPNWSMGKKITVDSATMMNKGLEVIEAKWLFDIPAEKIQIVVHPQSILHSAVEYCDGSVIGQMGLPDMRVPIAYALSYPERMEMTSSMKSLDFFSLKDGMTFYPADAEVFRTIGLAYEACRIGGSYPVALNGANEVLVDMFLKGKIRFTDIQDTLVKVMEEHRPVQDLDIEGILEEDSRIREKMRNMF
ncbi:1-deoxy-D-xylulose 5-phosphate reductoisomerase [uncultured Eubacterium sp.]|uniref:1-deoxy-D-xylulose-5-phosphate reductoisomerase n=1 Tax=Brotomerdimonas butyrica TaxID=2981721 RepID=UPI000821D68A|nr:1-deoxy-D-xylulose-5-phosphate reductoisomerase [Brotomerdimonas butyrica]MCU6756374.1 1-deoxy-D-xylulose-5-phosphate reductoisomerase [Brotomerdimonas butyrica]SCH81023.1 1-deoxy-D-xylulose 5-phosphate reductoisomerase [uncultured Eubacterium sp.]